METWTATTTTGEAASFHALTTDEVNQPEVWIHKVHRPTLVLGSTQTHSILNTEKATIDNIDICKRRSGGGVVRIDPDELWIDILLPQRSNLWKPDIGASMLWVGQAWAAALQDLLPNIEPTVYSGPLLNREIGKVVCFGGMGSGEVELDGYKVVGISQRRSRNVARFQCLVKQHWHPDLLRPYIAAANQAELPWEKLRVGFPPQLRSFQVDNTELAESLISHLPNP